MNRLEPQIIEKSIQMGLNALTLVLSNFLVKEIELERMARVGVLMIKSGAAKSNSLFGEIAELVLKLQKNDGGWIGVEDSVWCVAFLRQFEEYSSQYELGLNWLRAQKLSSGAWGKTTRDVGRIPITAILLYLLPQLSSKKSLAWLEKEWEEEFFLSPKLTYKGAFFLMAIRNKENQLTEGSLARNTLDWLATQQNVDYGWGPWKGHPVGSSPFCTGVALTGLLQYPKRAYRNVIVNGLKWIGKNQLEDGLWPDHYIEEGSTWSFYALTEGYRLLKGEK